MLVNGPWTFDVLFAAYTRYQQRTRGLKPGTIRSHLPIVREFLLRVCGEEPMDVTRVTPGDVVVFVRSVRDRFCPSSMKLVTASLRSFFRFLRFEGLCDATLEAAVPTVACRKLSTLPRALTDKQLDRLVTSLGIKSRCGYRDRAIVLCLASLGLRPGELAEITLDDIDWSVGALQVRTRKTGRGSVLPLPQEAGKAIVEYLREERPDTTERRVFLRHDGEFKGRAITAAIVTGAVVRALRRAGIEAPIAGAYVLRHTLASRMVRQGTSLKQVADFLGHRHLDTTTIYAKLDIPALSDVALPWPEVTP